MRRLKTALFGFLAFTLVTVACGGGAPAEEAAGEMIATAAPVDPAAQAAADRLVSRLGGADIKLVPTVRGTALIAYTQPIARRESDFVITTIRVKNLSENAIAGFQVDEFWFDTDGNTVTGDRFRLREPLLPEQVLDVELRVPRNSAMDRSNYEFSHQNGDIEANLFDELEDPPPAEGEEGEGEDREP
jgi:hypothetical protein